MYTELELNNILSELRRLPAETEWVLSEDKNGGD